MEKFYLVFSNLVGEHYRNNIKFSTNSQCKVLVTQVTIAYPESLLSVTWRLQGLKDGPKAGWADIEPPTHWPNAVCSPTLHTSQGREGGEKQTPRRDSEGN